MVLATAMDGSFTYINPSAERILGLRSRIWSQGADDGDIRSRRDGPDQPVAAQTPSHAENGTVGRFRPPIRCGIASITCSSPSSQLRGIDLQLRRADATVFRRLYPLDP